MAPPQRRPVRDILADINELSDSVLALVRQRSSRQDIERQIFQGLETAAEGQQQLEHELESARSSPQDVEWLIEALTLVEQKLAFFQGCTMRRSAAQMGREPEAEAHAREAEELAAQAPSMPGIFELVEAYKATEQLEQRILGLRESDRGSAVREPRILDLPRA